MGGRWVTCLFSPVIRLKPVMRVVSGKSERETRKLKTFRLVSFFFAFPFHNVNDEPLIFGVENADSVPTTADGNKYRPVHSKSRFHLLRLRWRLNVISQNGSSSLSVFYAFLNKCKKDITLNYSLYMYYAHSNMNSFYTNWLCHYIDWGDNKLIPGLYNGISNVSAVVDRFLVNSCLREEKKTSHIHNLNPRKELTSVIKQLKVQFENNFAGFNFVKRQTLDERAPINFRIL